MLLLARVRCCGAYGEPLAHRAGDLYDLYDLYDQFPLDDLDLSGQIYSWSVRSSSCCRMGAAKSA